jgi:pyruvate/2-oxoglutarate dehydrogenase complex dihydrolipoamide acyltransferase (E2) component
VQHEPAARAGNTASSDAPNYDVVPFSSIRRRAAAHMVQSKVISPHTLCSIEIDYFQVDRIRRAAKLTHLPFTAKAVATALRDFPHVNASVADDALLVHHRINLGIAVSLGTGGLIVPVVHDADTMNVTAIAQRITDIAARARSKRLTLDDVGDGTFTITNPGPFGTLLSAPIINQPQVAILSTDGIKKRPIVLDDSGAEEIITAHPIGNIALSFDHRAFDGAYAAGFIARIKQIVETEDWPVHL